MCLFPIEIGMCFAAKAKISIAIAKALALQTLSHNKLGFRQNPSPVGFVVATRVDDNLISTILNQLSCNPFESES